jgi:hypothetical protein
VSKSLQSKKRKRADITFIDGKYKGRASVKVLRVHISHKDKT